MNIAIRGSKTHGIPINTGRYIQEQTDCRKYKLACEALPTRSAEIKRIQFQCISCRVGGGGGGAHVRGGRGGGHVSLVFRGKRLSQKADLLKIGMN